MSEENQGHTHEYYLLGDTVPVRVTLGRTGTPIGAEVPDPETGELVIKNTVMSRLDQSWEVEQISKERFEELCGAGVKKNRPDKRAPRP
jgi:hypothetical protein